MLEEAFRTRGEVIRERAVFAVEHTVERIGCALAGSPCWRRGPRQPDAAAAPAGCVRSPRVSFACERELADGRIIIYGIPFEGRVNLRKGADTGPLDLRLASDSIETYSPWAERDLEDLWSPPA